MIPFNWHKTLQELQVLLVKIYTPSLKGDEGFRKKYKITRIVKPPQQKTTLSDRYDSTIEGISCLLTLKAYTFFKKSPFNHM